MAEMSPEEVAAFLALPLIAKLVTLRADGMPTIQPVWFEWSDGEALVFTDRDSAKVRRILADSRVALGVETGVGEREAWVTIEGVATVEPGGWELAERLTHRYYEPARASAALESWGKAAERWVMLRIRPERIRSLAAD